MVKGNNAKDDFKEGFSSWFKFLAKLLSLMFGSSKNIVMFFIQTGLFILSILLLVELFKINDLNYERIFLYLLLIISTKLSWIIQNTQ